MKQSLSKRIIILVFAKVLMNAIGIITAPIFTRILSVNDYGIFSLYLSFCDMIVIILGLQTYSTMNNALYDFPKEDYLEYCGNIFFLSLLCFFVGYVGCVIVDGLFVIIDADISVFLDAIFLNAFFVFAVNFYIKYLDVQKNALLNVIISIFLAVSTSILSIILVLKMDIPDIWGRILGYIVPYGIIASVVAICFLKKISIKKVKVHWRYCIGISIPLVFHTLSAIVLAQGDRFVILDILNEAEAGIYSFSYTIAMPISIVWTATNTAWVPEYYGYLANNDLEKLKILSKNYLRIFSLFTGMYMLVCPEAVRLLATEEYYSGIPTIPIVGMGHYFNYLYTFPVNYEFYNKKTKYIAMSTLAAAIFNIILNYKLIPLYGIFGAGIATLLSYIILFLVHDFIARYIIKQYHYSVSFYLEGVVLVSSFVLITYLLFERPFIRWTVAFIVFVICVISLVYEKKNGNFNFLKKKG